MSFIQKIEDVNNKQYKFIDGFIKNSKTKLSKDIHFDWDDNSVMEYCLCKVPEMNLLTLSKDSLDKDILNIQTQINSLVHKCNHHDISKKEFIKKYDILYKQLEEKGLGNEFFNRGRNQKDFISKSKFLVIKGVGGIGKSHFVKEIQEELKKQNTLYLVCYGKSNLDIDSLPWNEIKEYIKEKEFIIIVDAVNELEKTSRKKLYDYINSVKKFSNIRIILTYRTYSLMNDTISNKKEEKYIDSLATYLIDFSGVDFYNAILKLASLYKVDISSIYSIIETNNPMIINMLIESNILSSKGFLDKLNADKNIILITHIYENYIESHINRIVGKNKGKKYWEEIKEIALKMYKCNRLHFYKRDISNDVDKKDFINNLVKSGFVVEDFYSKGYKFAFEQLNNYIIARSLFSAISGKSDYQIIKHIKTKSQHSPYLKEYLLYGIFDMFGENIDKTIKILKECNFDDYLAPHILQNIHLGSNELAKEYQKHIIISSPIEYLVNLGGMPYRLFNCENYLFEIIEKDYKFIKLEYSFDEKKIISRLKFNLNCVNGKYINKQNLNEFFTFALICLYIPNDDIKVLSIKTLIDIIENVDNIKIDKLIQIYNNTKSTYVRNSILNVMIYLSKNNQRKCKNYISNISNEKTFTNFNTIKDYYSLQGDQYGFILNDKVNLLKEYYTRTNKEDFEKDEYYKIFFTHLKYTRTCNYLNYDDFSSDYKCNLSLLDMPKHNIELFNKELHKYFKRLKRCQCEESLSSSDYKERINALQIKFKIENTLVDKESIFYSFYKYFKDLMSYYEIPDELIKNFKVPYDKRYYYESEYILELYKFAESNFAGSIFSNYYEVKDYDDGIYFSLQDKRLCCGYQPKTIYDDEIHNYSFNAPIQNNENLINKLNNAVYKRIINLNNKIEDEHWAEDETEARKNTIELLKPYLIDNEKWLLLGARIDYNLETEDDKYAFYDLNIISSASNYKRKLKNELDRSKTIEIKNYYGALNDYINSNVKDCRHIIHFSGNNYLLEETHLMLPPSTIINNLNLHYDYMDSTWKDNANNIVIICDNNSHKFYHTTVLNSIYIKEKEYYKIEKSLRLFTYVFNERKGHSNENRVSKHYIIKKNKIKKEINNYEHKKRKTPFKCKFCKFHKIEKRKKYPLSDDMEKFLKEFLHYDNTSN